MPVIRWRGFHSSRDYKKFTVYTCVTIVRARRLRGLMSREVNGCPGQFLANVDQAPYCASLTCSSQSTTLPSSASACGRRRAVPVLFARREPDDVARPDLLDRPALALRETAAGRHDQCLSQRMRVPGRARAGLERDASAADARRIGRLEER